MAVSGEKILHVNRHSYFCLRVVPLQGRYPHNFGDPPASLDPNGEVKGVTTHNLNQSIGQFVRMAGTHKTLYIGKYHNGCCSDWCSAKQRNCTMPYYQARGMPKPEPKYGLGFDRFMPMPDMDYNAPGFNNITAVPGRIDEGYGEYINVTEYQTSFIGNESIRWMKEQMDAGHPFFAMTLYILSRNLFTSSVDLPLLKRSITFSARLVRRAWLPRQCDKETISL